MKSNLKSVLNVLFIVVFSINIAVANEQWVWVELESGVTKNLRAVIWGGSQFVAVGDEGTVITSPTGSHWTVKSSGTGADLSSVVWVEEAGYMVMGDSGRILLTSIDGIIWTKNETLLPAGDYFLGYAGGKYFASSQIDLNDSSVYVSYYSSDGNSWEVFVDCGLSSIAYGNGVFVWTRVIGRYYYCPLSNNLIMSPDGESFDINIDFNGRYGDARCWLTGPPYPPSTCMPSETKSLITVAYGNNVFLVSGTDDGEFGWSEDGKIWNIPWYQDWDSGRVVLRDIWKGVYRHIIYDGVRFLIVKNRELYSTENGKSLELIYSGLSKEVNAIASDGNANIVLISENGQAGLLTKETTANKINYRQRTKSLYSLAIHQNGNILTLTVPSAKAQISLYCISGKRLKIKPVFHANGTAQITLSNFAAGTYIVGVRSDKENWQRRIVLR